MAIGHEKISTYSYFLCLEPRYLDFFLNFYQFPRNHFVIRLIERSA